VKTEQIIVVLPNVVEGGDGAIGDILLANIK
jgi:hypothetical protein